MKRFLSLLLALAMVCCLLPTVVFASDIASGDCGEKVTWRIEHDGALFITGTGAMDDYEQGTAPWYEYRDSITCAYIEHTVTYIGDYAFADCPNMKEVTFLGDKPEIGSRIFQNNPVVNVYYPAYCDGWEYFDYLYGAEDTNWISHGNCEHEYEIYTEAPTCEGRGFTDYTCSLCGEYYQSDYINNLGHEFEGEYVLGWEASCEMERCWFDYCIRNCGCVDMLFEEGTALGHDYVDGVCTRCGETGGAISGETGITGTWGDNLSWSLDEDGLLIISGNGEMEEAECDEETGKWSYSWADYKDDITAVVIGDGVTSVATGAFGNYTTITSVSLPDTMQTLRNGAFFNTGITSLYVPDSVTTMEMASINNCTNLEYARIPGGLYLGELFYNCVSLKSVEFGGDCESGMSGFYNCDSLTDLDWYTQSVIGISDFRDCDGFTELVIPDWITDLGMCAFAECDNLSSVTIPASVTDIDSGAFADCSALAEIWFEGDVPALEGTIFENVTATAYYPADNASWTEAAMAEFGGDITWVAYEELTYPLTGTCGENLTWTLEESGILTITGTGTMYDYAEWWDEEGVSAPWPQENIVSVTIEEGVTSIGANAFYLSNLGSVSIADSVTSIGSNAFYYCASLTEVTLPRNLTEVGGNAFSWTGLYSVTIPGSLKTIGDGMFGFCQQLQSVVIEEGVEEIGSGAFSCCVNLTDITIPDTVTTIGSIAFSDCHSLREITIPASVTSIGDMAFYTDTGDMVLDSVKFCGDAPVFGEDVFLFATACCYYPAGNDTWTSVIGNTYDGAVAWIPYETVAEFLPGDMSGDGVIDDGDVARLLWHTLFPDAYTISGNADFNGDGTVDDADVAYLLWHTLFPEAYPLS